jgi:hypothetical protein
MDFYWNRETFASEAEANAFIAGLNWGDEPGFTVDGIEPCQSNPGNFDVIFARTEEYEEMQAEADGFWNSREQADARDQARGSLDGYYDADRKWHPKADLSDKDREDMENLWKREVRVANALYDLLELSRRLERNRPRW